MVGVGIFACFYQVNAEQADGHLYDGENHHGEGDAGLV